MPLPVTMLQGLAPWTVVKASNVGDLLIAATGYINSPWRGRPRIHVSVEIEFRTVIGKDYATLTMRCLEAETLREVIHPDVSPILLVPDDKFDEAVHVMLDLT